MGNLILRGQISGLAETQSSKDRLLSREIRLCARSPSVAEKAMPRNQAGKTQAELRLNHFHWFNNGAAVQNDCHVDPDVNGTDVRRRDLVSFKKILEELDR